MPHLPLDCALHPASPADHAAYAAISRRTFIETYRASHAADALARHVAATFGDARLIAELEDANSLVLAVVRGSTWIGYALLTAGEAPPEVRADRPIEVARFYVDSAWHGRGVSAPLMDAALDAARRQGHDAAWLAVWERNARAIRFYRRRGFAAVGHAAYIFDGHTEHDHVMVATLAAGPPSVVSPDSPFKETL